MLIIQLYRDRTRLQVNSVLPAGFKAETTALFHTPGLLFLANSSTVYFDLLILESTSFSPERDKITTQKLSHISPETMDNN